MSRWTNNFETHAFRGQWERVKGAIGEIQLDDPLVLLCLDEIGRMKKVCAYIDQAIVGVDPELLPLNFWDPIKDQMSACADQIRAFISNKNSGHLQNANGNLDSILSQTRPYILGKGKLGPALQAAAKAYSAALEDAVTALNARMLSGVKDLEESQARSVELVNEIETNLSEIDKKHDELFVGAGDQEAKANLLDGYIEEITNFYRRLVTGSGDSGSIKEEVAAAREVVKSGREAIEKLRGEAQATIRDLSAFEIRILGSLKEDGKREGGLDAELTSRLRELGNVESHQKTRYEALNTQIESLLPGATSAGLASAYREMKDSFDRPIENASKVFYWSIGVLIVGSVLLCLDKVSWSNGLLVEWVHLTDWQSVLRSIAYKLPFYGPAVWLAYYASKRRSEYQRLKQEYAHKEALAKSYENFKNQVEKLDAEDGQLMVSLLEKAIAAISYNASQTLDGKHGDKMPLQEAVERLTAVISKATVERNVG